MSTTSITQIMKIFMNYLGRLFFKTFNKFWNNVDSHEVVRNDTERSCYLLLSGNILHNYNIIHNQETDIFETHWVHSDVTNVADIYGYKCALVLAILLYVYSCDHHHI